MLFFFRRLLAGCLGGIGLLAPLAQAAPLDAFLAADTHLSPWQGQAEIAYDAVNSTVDLLKIRAKDPVYGGSNVGNGLAPLPAEDQAWMNRPYSLALTLPPLAGIVLAYEKPT